MSQVKQIEGMATELYDEFGRYGKMLLSKADSEAISLYLYRQGYRKASEVAAEIYEKLAEKATLNYYCGYITVALEDVAKVTREYAEEGNDGT